MSHIQNNMNNLKKLGAFKNKDPELYEYDQFIDNTKYLEACLKDRKIDICIDDGFHSDESILTTMKCVVPFLAKKFVYFVEDNREVHKKIKDIYPEYEIEHNEYLTVIYSH